MNLKKSFAICLSMLVSLVPASLRAMNEYQDEKDMLLSNSSNASKSNKKNDVDCPICLDTLDLNNEQKELEQAPNCPHKFHKYCLSEWKKYKNTCPTCRKKLGEVADPLKLLWEQRYRERFNDLGVIDIHDFPEMQGKSDEEIIDFLLKPLRDGNYKTIICFSHGDDNHPFNRQIFYANSETDYTLLKLQTPEGPKPAGIANWDFRWRLWDEVNNSGYAGGFDILPGIQTSYVCSKTPLFLTGLGLLIGGLYYYYN